jgi:hypothetical protein
VDGVEETASVASPSVISGALFGSEGHTGSQVAVADDGGDSAGEGDGVAFGDEEAIDSVSGEGARGVGGDDGQAHGHGFGRDGSGAFREGGEDKEVGGLVLAEEGFAREPAEEAEVATDGLAGDERGDEAGCAEFKGAGGLVFGEASGGHGEVMDALGEGAMADEEDAAGDGLVANLEEGIGDAVRDEEDAVRGKAVHVGDVIADGGRGRDDKVRNGAGVLGRAGDGPVFAPRH